MTYSMYSKEVHSIVDESQFVAHYVPSIGATTRTSSAANTNNTNNNNNKMMMNTQTQPYQQQQEYSPYTSNTFRTTADTTTSIIPEITQAYSYLDSICSNGNGTTSHSLEKDDEIEWKKHSQSILPSSTTATTSCSSSVASPESRSGSRSLGNNPSESVQVYNEHHYRPYVVGKQQQVQQQMQQRQQPSPSPPSPPSYQQQALPKQAPPPPPPQRLHQHRSPSQSHTLPCVTKAACPYEKMIPPTSYLYDELLKDHAYQHAIHAGIVWQSLASQHVHFPSLWYDGEEPSRPPLGCSRKQLQQRQRNGKAAQHSIWKYLGRHRVVNDIKLNTLIGTRGTSGKLLLHIIVKENTTNEGMADICVGCYHPNARGIRPYVKHDPQLENCRDVWIGYRSRCINTNRLYDNKPTRIESILKHYNKNKVYENPLGGEIESTMSKKKNNKSNNKDNDNLPSLIIDNNNLRAVFGDKPPLYTLFVTEKTIYDLLYSYVNTKCPASIVLMREYLLDNH